MTVGNGHDAEGQTADSAEFDFGHLLGTTRHVTIEEAAVRGEAPVHDPDGLMQHDEASEVPEPAPPSVPPAGFCENCGTPRNAEDRFCERCGSRLAAPVVPVAFATPVVTASPLVTSPSPAALTTPPGLEPTSPSEPIAATSRLLNLVPPPADTSSSSDSAVGERPSPSEVDFGMTRDFREAPVDVSAAHPAAPISSDAEPPGLISFVPGVSDLDPAPIVEVVEPTVQNDDAPRLEVAVHDLVDPTDRVVGPTGTDKVAIVGPTEFSPKQPETVDFESSFALPHTDAGDPAGTISLGDSEDDDEDDPHTVSLAALRAARAKSEPPGPTVQAVHCPDGHANPPHADTCRRCHAIIGDRSVSVVPRPVLGTLRFDGDHVELLDRPMVLGRKPKAEQAVGSEAGRAVALDDPDKLLSRVHAEVRLADWQVQIVDRESMNHTFVQVPGQALFQLRPGETFPIPPGTRVVLADTVSFIYSLEID